MTEEQAKAFATLLGDGTAFLDKASGDWHVYQTDRAIYKTYDECLEQLADESDFQLVPYGEEGS